MSTLELLIFTRCMFTFIASQLFYLHLRNIKHVILWGYRYALFIAKSANTYLSISLFVYLQLRSLIFVLLELPVIISSLSSFKDVGLRFFRFHQFLFISYFLQPMEKIWLNNDRKELSRLPYVNPCLPTKNNSGFSI